MVVGDLNVPSVAWSDNQSTPINRDGCAIGEDLFELVGDNFMEQLIEGPANRAGNKLDLLLCNCPDIISDVLLSSPDEHTFPTDHFSIEFSVRTKFSRAKPVRRNIFNYNQVDFAELRRALSPAYFNVAITDDIEQSWKQWKNLFLSIVNVYVPIKTLKNSPPWIDEEVHHLIRKN